MTSEEKTELVKYRIDKAKETLQEVELLVNNERWNTAVNRLYYACFYAVTALLVTNDFFSKTHSGAKRMFGLHFVSTGMIEKELAVFYSDLFDMRQQGDYEDFFYFEKEEVMTLLPTATQFVNKVDLLINEANK